MADVTDDNIDHYIESYLEKEPIGDLVLNLSSG